MLFCFTAQYTPQAINAMMDDPTTNRGEAIKKLLDTAGAKLVALYSYPAEGPGVMLIFDVSDPEMAPALMGVAFAGGAIQNVKLTRLLTQDELKTFSKKPGSFAPHTSRPVSNRSSHNRAVVFHCPPYRTPPVEVGSPAHPPFPGFAPAARVAERMTSWVIRVVLGLYPGCPLCL